MTNRSRAQDRTEERSSPPATPDAEIEQLKSEVERLTRERDDAGRQGEEYLLLLQRERAEFANYRRRTAEERERELGLAGEDLIRKVLALADDFDRAIEAKPADLAGHAWLEGIEAIDRKLRSLLESEGVVPIDASPGRAFDPREHDAIANVPGSGRQEGEIVDEVRRGYRLRDRVLRPALVAVAAAEPPPTSEDGSSSGDGDHETGTGHDEQQHRSH